MKSITPTAEKKSGVMPTKEIKLKMLQRAELSPRCLY